MTHADAVNTHRTENSKKGDRPDGLVFFSVARRQCLCNARRGEQAGHRTHAARPSSLALPSLSALPPLAWVTTIG